MRRVRWCAAGFVSLSGMERCSWGGGNLRSRIPSAVQNGDAPYIVLRDFSLRSSRAFLTARPLPRRRIYFAVQNGNVPSPCAEENSSCRSARAFLTVTPPGLFRYADALLGCNGRASFHRSDHALPIVCPLSCRPAHSAEKNGDVLLGCDGGLPAGTQPVCFLPPVCCNVTGGASLCRMQTCLHAVPGKHSPSAQPRAFLTAHT